MPDTEPRTREGTVKEFEALPEPSSPAKKPNRWLPTLEKIQAGRVVFIAYEADKDKKGSRIGLARVAAGQQIKLEFREDTQKKELAARIHPTLAYTPPKKKTASS